MRGEPPLPPSPRVRLEVAFLDDDPTAPAQESPAAVDEPTRLTVLVVAAEADVRRYVRECLRSRTDLRVLEAATVGAAVAVAVDSAAQLLVVDEPERHVLGSLSQLRAVVIVDEVPHDGPVSGSIRLLARPFSAEGLMAAVDELLS